MERKPQDLLNAIALGEADYNEGLSEDPKRHGLDHEALYAAYHAGWWRNVPETETAPL